MNSIYLCINRRRAISLSIILSFSFVLLWMADSEANSSAIEQNSLRLNMQFSAPWEKRFDLKQGETIEISVSLPRPSLLPQHGRVGVSWKLIAKNTPTGSPRKPEAFGIYTNPTADWKKVLHALDPD